TRSKRDWSSDVCSSDLSAAAAASTPPRVVATDLPAPIARAASPAATRTCSARAASSSSSSPSPTASTLVAPRSADPGMRWTCPALPVAPTAATPAVSSATWSSVTPTAPGANCGPSSPGTRPRTSTSVSAGTVAATARRGPSSREGKREEVMRHRSWFGSGPRTVPKTATVACVNIAFMTGLPDLVRLPHPQPAPEAERERVLADPGFGRFHTDHMVTISYSPDKGWHGAELGPYAPISLDPETTVFHYGQAIFEGLKVYRQPGGELASFRPSANAARFRTSAERLAMPALPDEMFLDSLRELVAVDADWVPPAGGDAWMYLRRIIIGGGSRI